MSLISKLPSHSQSFCRSLGIQNPIILAPMLGSSSPELLAAIGRQGGLANWGCGPGFKTTNEFRGVVQRITNEMMTTSSTDSMSTSTPKFGFNYFVPDGCVIESKNWTKEERVAVAEARETQWKIIQKLDPTTKTTFGDDVDYYTDPDRPSLDELNRMFQDQIDRVVQFKHSENARSSSGDGPALAVVSFHFGFPNETQVHQLIESNLYLIGNATSVDEATILQDLGADAIIAQSSQAGGHLGSFYGTTTSQPHTITTAELLADLTSTLELPIIAAGGLMNGEDCASALQAGASAVQLGTAFLPTMESNVPERHKRRLLSSGGGGDDAKTIVSKGFTGKFARGLPNDSINHTSASIPHERLPNCFNGLALGRWLQGVVANKEGGRAEYLYMWAGDGYARCRGIDRGTEGFVSAEQLYADITEELVKSFD